MTMFNVLEWGSLLKLEQGALKKNTSKFYFEPWDSRQKASYCLSHKYHNFLIACLNDQFLMGRVLVTIIPL